MRMTIRHILLCTSVTVVAVLIFALPCHAGFGAGGRFGLSVEPDQVVIGGQAAMGSIMPFVDFVPSVDFGFGDDVEVTAINFDLQYDLPSLPRVGANLYLGAGPTVAVYNFDNGTSDTEIGLSLIAGLKNPMSALSYYNLETRFGLSDIPDIKILLGIMFGL
jgi:hypothetical protein